MRKRTLKVALLAALATILVLSFSSVALADQTWSDLPDTVTAKYGITDNQVGAISDGFPDGTWKPYQSVTRAQFTKMAVLAFDIPLANPATPSFTDVPKTHIFYQYIEGAKAAAITNGTTPTTFGPNEMVTRQQAAAIVSRWVAQVNGYNLATMYTADQITALLAHFGDAASISSALRAEVAFAYDMGITTGDAYGNFNPLANMMRIQGAAFLIRAQGLVPPANWTAAKIEQVTADKSENLIGQPHTATFNVTTADGHPAKGVLVDFDVAYANPLYVGNVSPQAAMTDSMGNVSVNLNSAEPGTQRLYATIVTPSGLMTEMATKYWLALDEVYLTDPEGEADDCYEVRYAENNAGEEHTYCARVVVFGPGPLSTSAQDWYNVLDPLADPNSGDIDENDGVDFTDDSSAHAQEGEYWCYDTELAILAHGWVPRTMAGITVEWAIVNVEDDDPDTDKDETVPSVGDIIAVDGLAMPAAKTAMGVTDEDGLSCITIMSEQTGTTVVEAVADYEGNPYPKQLLNHDAVEPDDWDHWMDWHDQPSDYAMGWKTWIPHVIGGDSDAPITPTYAVNNTGEVEDFVLTLEDVYGNPIPGYTVEWWIQGVGFFKTDGSTWSGIGEQNKDVDVTDEDGQAAVSLKSLIPGQTIVHVKVMDKMGLPWKEWNVVKQWFSIDDVTLGLIDEDGDFDPDPGVVENEVDTGHTWTAWVGGAKYVYTIYDLNRNGLRDDAVLIGNREDMKAARGHTANFDGTVATQPDGTKYKQAGVDVPVGVPFRVAQSSTWYVRFADMEMADSELWLDLIGTVPGEVPVADGIAEVWSGLEGKNVYFFNNVGACPEDPTSNTPIKTVIGDGAPMYVGSITSDTMVVTDEMGFADVDINSLNKGYQYVYAVADYKDNPQDGDPLKPLDWDELRWDCATKLWEPADVDPDETVIWAQGNVVGDRWVNPVDPAVTRDTGTGQIEVDNTNVERIAVQVFDTYGNALEGYKVTWEIVGQGTTTAGQIPTYHPYAHFDEDVEAEPDGTPAHDNPLPPYESAGVGDLNPWVNSNMYIGDAPAGHPQAVPDAADADYAWGWTLNHQIDFTLSEASAAYVDLVLDETYDELVAMADGGPDHFTNIVNIRVYTPKGALMDELEVTKVWTLEPQSLDSILLEQSIDGTESNPYDVDPITDLDGVVYYRATLVDQFGGPIASLDTVNGKLYLDCDVLGQDQIVDLSGVASDLDGYIFYMTGALEGGVYTATYWVDDDLDNQIDATELKSNSVVVNVVINNGGGTPPELAASAEIASAVYAGSLTSLTVNKPAGTASGDLMVALVQLTDASEVLDPTAPNGWVLQGSTPSTFSPGVSYDWRTFVYTKVAGDTEPSSYTWSKPDALNWDAIKATLVTYGPGFGLANVSATWTDAASGTSITGNAASTTLANQYVVLVGGSYSGTDPGGATPPTDFAENVDDYDSASYFFSYFANHNPMGAAGSYGPYSATLAGAATHRAGWLLALTNP